MIFKRKNKRKNQSKDKKPKVLTINPRKKFVLFLWCLLASSFSFAVYKHVTAIDTHTVQEIIIIEQELVDTNTVENFVRNFAQIYYAWESDDEAIEERNHALEGFLTEDLQLLNGVQIHGDILTSSSVRTVQIWSVKQKTENEFDVTFSVTQRITEEDDEETLESAYVVSVYMDEQDNLVIIKNPTITNIPARSTYQPTPLENDNSLDSEFREEIDEFLSSFFALYPTASQSELSYYVEDGVLPLIQKEYVFSELINPVYIQEGENIRASVFARYHDERTKADQLSQYEFILEKNGTWKIIE